MDNDLELLLSKRYVPQMRSHLPERIIDAARSQSFKSQKTGDFQEILKELFFVPRRIAFLCVFLLSGLVLGGSISHPPIDPNNTQNPLNFNYIEDGLDSGNWL